MERFARTIIGYHGCEEKFAGELLNGHIAINEWKPSRNAWDWLGHGVYFWEHSPQRALRWARENCSQPSVIGGVIQLGRCFDLMDESVTASLVDSFAEFASAIAETGQPLPDNRGAGWKLRRLDCLVINDCLNRLQLQGVQYDSVRGAFLEGEPVYPGAGFFRETHIQVAVRNSSCILGVFRPNL